MCLVRILKLDCKILSTVDNCVVRETENLFVVLVFIFLILQPLDGYIFLLLTFHSEL